MEHNNWNGFKKGVWHDEINVRDFIQQNYKEYMESMKKETKILDLVVFLNTKPY